MPHLIPWLTCWFSIFFLLVLPHFVCIFFDTCTYNIAITQLTTRAFLNERSKRHENYELALSSLRVNRAFDLVYVEYIYLFYFTIILWEAHRYIQADMWLIFHILEGAGFKQHNIIAKIIIIMKQRNKKKDNWKARSKSLFVRTLIHA